MPRTVLAGGQSTTRIVYAELDVKSWTTRPPSVDAVRPSCCASCSAPSRLAGGALGLHGHGLRSRDQWGPLAPGERPGVGEVLCRRYRCRHCGAVVLVVPRGVVRRRLYSAGAIALALALWALERLAPAEARRRVSPWPRVGAAAARRWASLHRWTRAVSGRALFGVLRVEAGVVLRDLAARVASAIAAWAPSSADALSLATRAMLGAAHVAR